MAAILNNKFMPGDLLHIPQGTILYQKILLSFNGSSPTGVPKEIVKQPTIGLVLDKDTNDFYLISIKDQEFLVHSDNVNIYNEELKHVY